MYTVGELIVYCGTGVCRVEAIEEKTQPDGSARGYYRLKPLYQSGTISVPVDGKVFMRPVISREEAEALIDELPTMPAETLPPGLATKSAISAEASSCSSCRSCWQMSNAMAASIAYRKHFVSRSRARDEAVLSAPSAPEAFPETTVSG